MQTDRSLMDAKGFSFVFFVYAIAICRTVAADLAAAGLGAKAAAAVGQSHLEAAIQCELMLSGGATYTTGIRNSYSSGIIPLQVSLRCVDTLSSSNHRPLVTVAHASISTAHLEAKSTGVTWVQTCGAASSSTTTTGNSSSSNAAYCLLRLCSTEQHRSILLVNSTLIGVNATAWHPNASMLCIAGNSKVVMHSAVVANNSAAAGIISVEGEASLHLHNCSAVGNNGGVLHVLDHATAVVMGSKFTSNVATFGGALQASGHAQLQLLSSLLTSNSAEEGGAVAVQDAASCVITYSSVLNNNSALYGAALAAAGSGSVRIEGNSSVANNTASGNATAGGGFFIRDGLTLKVTGSRLIGNSAVGVGAFGGAGAAIERCKVVISNSTVSGNYVQDSSQCGRFGEGCGLMHGGAALGGGGFGITGHVSMIVHDSIFANNSVRGLKSAGGAIAASNSSSLLLHNCHVINNSAAWSRSVFGGAVAFVPGRSNTSAPTGVISGSLFDSNSVHGDLVSGGALAVVPFRDSTAAAADDTSALAMLAAAAAFGSSIPELGTMHPTDCIPGDCVELNILNCTFLSNSVRGNFAAGGAIAAANRTLMNVSDSSFVRNMAVGASGSIPGEALTAGGAISATTIVSKLEGSKQALQLVLKNCSFVLNVAGDDVGVLESAGLQQHFLPKASESSSAENAAAALDASSAINATAAVPVDHPAATDNSAGSSSGGGRGMGGCLCFGGGGALIKIIGCLFDRCVALGSVSSAGAIVTSASLHITAGTVIRNCMAVGDYAYGGAITARMKAHVVVDGGSVLFNNSARGLESYGGAFTGEETSTLVISGQGTAVTGNGAYGPGTTWGGGMCLDASSSCIVQDGAALNNNTAFVGGGCYTGGRSGFRVSNGYVEGNSAGNHGGGIYIAGTSQVKIEAASISYNRAFEGGAIYATAGSSSTTAAKFANKNATSSSNDHSIGAFQILLAKGTVLQGNTASSGGAIFHQGGNLTLDSGAKIIGNNASIGGGVAVMELPELKSLTPAARQPGILVVLPAAGGIIGNTAAVAGGGVYVDDADALITNTTLVLPGLLKSQRFEVLFRNIKKNVASYGHHDVFIVHRACQPGEVAKGLWCESCPPGMFSFNPSEPACRPCPAHAICPGGAAVMPEQGYWHSSATSVQIHRCGGFAACIPMRGTPIDVSSSIHTDASIDGSGTGALHLTSGIPGAGHPGFSDWQCAQGYWGNLCGSCSHEVTDARSNKVLHYGSYGHYKCGVCTRFLLNVLIYVLAYVAMLAMLLFTAHHAWLDSSCPGGAPDPQASDFIKVLVLFLQYLAIASLPVLWPRTVTVLFTGATWLFTPASSTAFSIDCMLRHVQPDLAADAGSIDKTAAAATVPLPVQQLLLVLAAAGVMLILLVVLQAIGALIGEGCHRLAAALWMCMSGRCSCDAAGVSWAVRTAAAATAANRARSCSQFQARLPAACILLLLFYFPSLVHVSLALFACQHLDRDVAGDGSVDLAATAVHGYWVLAMQQPCWEGWHKTWSLGLGIPCVLLFCIGFPLGVVVWLSMNHNRLHTVEFRQKYGALYKSYRQQSKIAVLWEGLQCMQTVLLVAVTTFGSRLGTYYQALLLNVAFVLIFVLHVVFKPHRCCQLRILQVACSICLCVTSYVALTLVSVDRLPPAAYTEAIGLVLLVGNLGCLCWGLLKVCQATATGKKLLSACGCWILRMCGACGWMCGGQGASAAVCPSVPIATAAVTDSLSFQLPCHVKPAYIAAGGVQGHHPLVEIEVGGYQQQVTPKNLDH